MAAFGEVNTNEQLLPPGVEMSGAALPDDAEGALGYMSAIWLEQRQQTLYLEKLLILLTEVKEALSDGNLR